MFTGIVSQIGEIASVTPDGTVVRLVVGCDYDPATIAIGASIACSGVCLTVTGVEIGGNGRTFVGFDAAPETLAVTTAGTWTPGTLLNLERALKVGDELGGHIVSGHVDGIARIVGRGFDCWITLFRHVSEKSLQPPRHINRRCAGCAPAPSAQVRSLGHRGRR